MGKLAIALLACWMAFSTNAQVIERYQFDIDPQPISDAMVSLALQRGLNIVFLADLTENLSANPVKGRYTLAEALDLLLDGSGLRARISNNRLIQIERFAQQPTQIQQQRISRTEPELPPQPPVEFVSPVTETIDTIEVVCKLISPYNLGTTVSSTKTQRDFLATPQIVNALTSALANDIAARDYTDSSLLVSSATYLERSTGVSDEIRLRGFAYPSLKINGIGAHAYVAPTDIAFIDSIEVAKGPSSVLFGRMEPGGMINMMLKQPGSASNAFSIRHGTDQFLRSEMDVSLSLGDSSDIRLIAFSQRQGDADTLDLDDADGAMLALDYQFENGAVFNAYYRYESQDVLQQFGSPIGGFNTSVQFFENEEGDIEVIAPLQEDLRSSLDIERQSLNLSINDWSIGDWSAALHLQYDSYQSNSSVRYPIIDSFFLDLEDIVVSSDDLTAAFLEDDELRDRIIEGFESVSIEDDNIDFEQEPYAYDTQFLSIESTLYRTDWIGGWQIEQLYGVNINASEPETLIWQTHDTRSTFIPVDQTQVLFNPETASSNVEDRNIGAFGQWAVSYQSLTGFIGVRWDQLSFNSKSLTVPRERDYHDLTTRIGAVYQVAENSSVYFNYSESFSPQFDVLEIPNPASPEPDEDELVGLFFPSPARSVQWEFGVKQLWFDERLQTSCAFFDISKKGIQSTIIHQDNSGVECDVAGTFGENWHINFGISWLDAEIVDSFDDDLIGNTPRMTPERSANLWLSRDIEWTGQWSGNAGIGYTFVDERFISAENLQPLEAYHVVDFGLTLDYQQTLSVSLFLRNAFDERYTLGVFNALPFWTNPGPGRTFETRLTYRF